MDIYLILKIIQAQFEIFYDEVSVMMETEEPGFKF